MPTVIGLDCGGSSSRALATNDLGEIIWRAQSGACNIATTPDGELRKHIESLLAGAPPCDHICGCFAGLLTSDDRLRASTLLSDLIPSANIRVEPDYFAALYAAPETADAVVIAGTGSLVCSLNAGAVVKSGGGGYLLGDEGSGFRYGLETLRNFVSDPKAASIAVRAEISRLFGSLEPADVISRTYRPSLAVSRIAGLLTAFTVDLKHQEPYALRKLQQESDALASVIMCHTRLYLSGRKELNLALAGGVWKASSKFGAHLRHALLSAEPTMGWTLKKLTNPPVVGAVRLARTLLK